MWQEVAEGVYRRRYESLDLNVGVVIGGEGVLVIDTRASHRQAQQLLDELQTLTALPPRWVLNTHYHWDHCWGNALFPSAQIWGHERCRASLMEDGESARQGVLGWMPEETFESGLKKTIAWYIKNEAWTRRVQSGEYRQWIDTQYK